MNVGDLWEKRWFRFTTIGTVILLVILAGLVLTAQEPEIRGAYAYDGMLVLNVWNPNFVPSSLVEVNASVTKVGAYPTNYLVTFEADETIRPRKVTRVDLKIPPGGENPGGSLSYRAVGWVKFITMGQTHQVYFNTG